jgi:hypothetical protein
MDLGYPLARNKWIPKNAMFRAALTSLFQIIRHRLFVHLRTKWWVWTMLAAVMNLVLLGSHAT